MSRIIVCKQCGQTRPLHGHGLCASCDGKRYYHSEDGTAKRKELDRQQRDGERPVTTVVCSDCGQLKAHCAKGLCRPCYIRKYELEHPRSNNPQRKAVSRATPCPVCGKVMRDGNGRGMCLSCYKQKRREERETERAARPQTVVCKQCGRATKHRAHGLCQRCYQAAWRDNDDYRSKRREYTRKRSAGEVGRQVVCARCGELKPHLAKGLCAECWSSEYRSTDEYKKRHAEREHEYRVRLGDEYRAREHERNKRRRETRRPYQHAYYEAHKTEVKAYAIRWRKADPERQAVYMQRRRARERNVEDTLTPDQWKAILEKYNHSCYYCGRDDVPLQLEHKIPVSRNGGTTAENIVPACSGCNQSKKRMTPEEFAEFLRAIGKSPKFHP